MLEKYLFIFFKDIRPSISLWPALTFSPPMPGRNAQISPPNLEKALEKPWRKKMRSTSPLCTFDGGFAQGSEIKDTSWDGMETPRNLKQAEETAQTKPPP